MTASLTASGGGSSWPSPPPQASTPCRTLKLPDRLGTPSNVHLRAPRVTAAEPVRLTDEQVHALAAWCDARLATIHRGRYDHLRDWQFWPLFAACCNQWADEQAKPYRPQVRWRRADKPWLSV